MAAAPRTIVFAMGGRIARTELPALCERVCAMVESSGADVCVCDVISVDADAVMVDALARLQLVARRRGCRVRLRHAPDELLELLAFMGLRDVLA